MKYFLVVFLLLPILTFSQTYTGWVTYVIDGDTFVFQTEEGSIKVRMIGIDAPEMDH